METVFDHNITKEEWSRLYEETTKEDYLSFKSQERAYYDIATLFYIRGDEKRAEEYAAKLPLDVQHDLWRTLTHS